MAFGQYLDQINNGNSSSASAGFTGLSGAKIDVEADRQELQRNEAPQSE